MFYIECGEYSDTSFVACTENESLAELYCALKNSSPKVYQRDYRYYEVDMLEDIFKANKEDFVLQYLYDIKVTGHGHNYSFEVTNVEAITEYDKSMCISLGINEIEESCDYETKSYKGEFHFSISQNDDEKLICYLRNLKCSFKDNERALRVAQDLWYQCLNLTDGEVDIDMWKAHMKMLNGTGYTIYRYKLLIDINRWDGNRDTRNIVECKILGPELKYVETKEDLIYASVKHVTDEDFKYGGKYPKYFNNDYLLVDCIHFPDFSNISEHHDVIIRIKNFLLDKVSKDYMLNLKCSSWNCNEFRCKEFIEDNFVDKNEEGCNNVRNNQ